MLVTVEIPSNDDLRKIRESLGLSQDELAGALGFRDRGHRTVRAWEEDPKFHPTQLAWNALRYLLAVVEIYRETDPETPAFAKISRLLPESLR